MSNLQIFTVIELEPENMWHSAPYWFIRLVTYVIPFNIPSPIFEGGQTVGASPCFSNPHSMLLAVCYDEAQAEIDQREINKGLSLTC